MSTPRTETAYTSIPSRIVRHANATETMAMSNRPFLMKVQTTGGATVFVSRRDYESKRQFLPLYTEGGKHYGLLPKNRPLKANGDTIAREMIEIAVYT